jgi:hypothetical protein
MSDDVADITWTAATSTDSAFVMMEDLRARDRAGGRRGDRRMRTVPRGAVR